MAERRTRFDIKEGDYVLDGYWYEGYGCVHRKGDHECIIMAPSMVELRIMWKKITSLELKDRDCQKVVMGSAKKLNPIDFVDDSPIWLYNRKRNVAFLGTKIDLISGMKPKELGPAERKTINECKILMRKLGWHREDIENVDIKIDDIPW